MDEALTAPPTASEREAGERTRATRSPLALIFELVLCELATTHEQDDAVIPTYTFNHPCVYGKAQPDQDCRLCPHHRIARVGAGDTTGTHRYLYAGMVLPVTEDEAGKVVEFLALYDVTPLNRPHWQQRHAELLAERQATEARQAEARAGERHQRSPGVAPVQGD